MKYSIPQHLSAALSANGVREVVVSSGSRSMPLVTAVAANERIRTTMVVDERVAAFAAVGMIRCTQQPVAIICTSGSAMLNYAPAVAEAFYMSLPLIVVTADRPASRIDANEGQTIHQVGALANVVKQTFSVDGSDGSQDGISAARATFASAISIAMSGRPGPVHINIHLAEPLAPTLEMPSEEEIRTVVANPQRSALNLDDVNSLAGIMHGKRCMIYVGPGDFRHLQQSLVALQSQGVMVMSEIGSQLVGFAHDIDIVKYVAGNDFCPEILITIGGAPLCRRWRTWAKNIPGLRHFSISLSAEPADTYYALERIFAADPVDFISALSAVKIGCKPLFVDMSDARDRLRRIFADAPWSDMKAVVEILNHLPENCSMHCSNGTLVRLLNSYPGADFTGVWVNRGVNGIDGSTSTALGFSTCSENMTVLLTGDMSALYDIGSLFSGLATSRFKMVVFNNGGGEIFRMIKATGEETMCERYLCHVPTTDWQAVAAAAGFVPFRAESVDRLRSVLPSFLGENDRPALLEVVTPAGNSEVYRQIIKSIKH